MISQFYLSVIRYLSDQYKYYHKINFIPSPISEYKDFIMKKLFIPVICSSVVLLSASSVSAKPELLKTADVLCHPNKHNTVIKTEDGMILFNRGELSRYVGDSDSCRTSVNNLTNDIYTFSSLNGEKKESVNNPLSGIEFKKVYRVSITFKGYAYSNGQEVLTGNVDPDVKDYQAIVRQGIKVIPAPQVKQPEPTKERTFTHIIK